MRELALLALALAVGYVAGPSVFFSMCAAVILWTFAKGEAEHTLAIALPAIFRAALFAGAFHFETPSQIVDLAIGNADPVGLILKQDLWWARYLVTYPVIAAVDHWGMRFSDAFALYSTAVLPLTVMVLLKTLRAWRQLDERSHLIAGLAFLVLVAGVATQMNGRLIPAHLGIGIIMLAQSRVAATRHLGLKEGLLLAFGVVLSHMTSGTGLVAYMVLSATAVLFAGAGIGRARVLAVLWLITAAYGPLLYLDLTKNVDYFGGGPQAAVTMLQHGPGRYLLLDARIAIAAIAAALLAVALLWRLRAAVARIPRPLWPAVVALPVTSLGGLYGYSTLTMGIPPAVLLAVAVAVAFALRRPDSETDDN